MGDSETKISIIGGKDALTKPVLYLVAGDHDKILYNPEIGKKRIAGALFTAPDGTEYHFTKSDERLRSTAKAGLGLAAGGILLFSPLSFFVGATTMVSSVFFEPQDIVSGKDANGKEYNYNSKHRKGHAEDLDTLIGLLQRYPDTEVVLVRSIKVEKGDKGEQQVVIENFDQHQRKGAKIKYGDDVVDDDKFITKKDARETLLKLYELGVKKFGPEENIQREYKLAHKALRKLGSGGSLTEKEKENLLEEAKEHGLEIVFDIGEKPQWAEVKDPFTQQSYIATKGDKKPKPGKNSAIVLSDVH